MDTRKTLKELFESRRQELAERLNGLSLPNDAEKIQKTVTNYLNELFDSDGEFRQSLTQSEDYILQAAMSLLTAQRSMIGEFSISQKPDIKPEDSQEPQNRVVHSLEEYGGTLQKDKYPYVLGGTAVGGAAGALILGTWGAVFGAIAGTAMVLYYASTQQQNKSQKQDVPITALPKANAIVQKINVEAFVNIVENICDSVDSLILTFRTQINRVVEKYENQEKPVLEKEYGVLLDAIQSLLGASFQTTDDKRQKRIDSRIEDLEESLENYNLEVVKYSEEAKNYFDETDSDKVNETTMVLPAIVKQGVIVKKGKVFIKK